MKLSPIVCIKLNSTISRLSYHHDRSVELNMYDNNDTYLHKTHVTSIIYSY